MGAGRCSALALCSEPSRHLSARQTTLDITLGPGFGRGFFFGSLGNRAAIKFVN
jgi:hypothetical protein